MKKVFKLYHGSPYVVERPTLAKGRPDNDYGPGFYCTEDIEMAREWACKGKEPPAKVNAYELNACGLKVLDLSSEPYTVLNWIAVLLANRRLDLDEGITSQVRDYLIANFMPPVAEADVVIGYRADDSYFRYAESFVGNGLHLGGLESAMRLGRLGIQIALVSEKAFSALRFTGSENVNWGDYHGRYVQRDRTARKDWSESVKKAAVPIDAVFAMDILRRGLESGGHGL